MIVNNSPDITLLKVKATFDISGATPQVVLVNQSVGSNLAGLTWWFVIKSPTTTLIHDGSATIPDINGVWSTHTFNDAWPRPMNQIEWSGAPYTIQAFVKDSLGSIITGPVQAAYICKPQGNLPNAKNTYGRGDVQVTVQCDKAAIWFADQTNASYKGLDGTRGSSVLRVIFPIDDTDNIPTPFVDGAFTSALVPISYSSPNYQFLYTSIWDYDLGDDVHIRIKYYQQATFGVYCNIDLLPLVCEFEKLSQSISNGSCSDLHDAQNKMNLITPKMFQVWMGMAQPLTGINVAKLIDEIKEIGGFDCDCCNASSGILPATSSVIGGYNFGINHVGGDVGGTVSVNGSNIAFNLHDVTYIVQMQASSPAQTTAFSFTPTLSSDGYTKTFTLSIDVAQFGYDLAAAIGSNTRLLNAWQALFNGGGAGTIVVQGDCVFTTTSECTYTFTLLNTPTTAPFAKLTKITTSLAQQVINYTYRLSDLAGLQARLSEVIDGTVVVTNPTGNTILVTVTGNNGNLRNVFYNINGTPYTAAVTQNCVDYEEVGVDFAVQKLINYVCRLRDNQIKTSQAYEICYVNAAGTKVVQTVDSDTELNTLIASLLSNQCTTIDYIVGLNSASCAALKNVYGDNPALQITAADGIHGTKGQGACSSIPFLEAFRYMLTAAASDSTTRTMFCDLVALCGAGLACEPYEYIEVITTTYGTTCAPIVGIGIIMTN